MVEAALLESRIVAKLERLYGRELGYGAAESLIERLKVEPKLVTHSPISEKTNVLITYGDHLQSDSASALNTLHQFSKDYLKEVISHIHILPFYPYSSDDGFSVIDYVAVDPKLGDWDDIEGLQTDFGLMFDYVLNHISAKSRWFKAFLNDDPMYRNFFITTDSTVDLSLVRRPRTSPLLTAFETVAGTKHVWTTFSDDQIDLNYANPEVLLAMIDVLLLYVRKGAEFIRMDAVTYLWKEIGTDCVHLEETHLVVQLFRDILDYVAPGVRIITETNVPHSENISYFGDGYSEAQGVYNFALPPLLAHTLQTADKTAFESWARSLSLPSDKTFFFNFTSSHDGIGVTPVKGILSPGEISAVVERVKQNGGRVSYKTMSDGSSEPYELNSTYYNALSSPDEETDMADKKFIVSQAIMLAMRGVPGIYIGSLLGNKNWQAGVETLGYNRAINRQKLTIGHDLQLDDLRSQTSERGRIFSRYRQLLAIRSSQPAFSPQADMDVIDLHSNLIALERTASDGQRVLAIHNITNTLVEIQFNEKYQDLITGSKADGCLSLHPYDVAWLEQIGY